MNISSPVPSQIQAVDFGFLSRHEIRKISVKRIHHTEAISRELGFPIPGGLYDQALGSRGDYLCTTCNLGHLCPGHAGHIELPSPVYHPIFMDQLMKLLNGQCGSCFKFRITDNDRHAFSCKLKLLRYGMVQEARELDSIAFIPRHRGKASKGGESYESDNSFSNGDSSSSALISARNKFMVKVFKRHGGKKHLQSHPSPKVEILVEARRLLLREILNAVGRTQKCPLCGGHSPRYRKDGFNKIFKQPLSQKFKAQNAQLGIRLKEPVLEKAQIHKSFVEKRRAKQEMEDDEGIAMEVDDFSNEDAEGEFLGNDTALSQDNLLDSAAITSSTNTVKESNADDAQQYMTPAMILGRIEVLFKVENDILGLIYQSQHSKLHSLSPTAEMFFVHDILVTPNKYRPDMKTGAGMITEAEQNKSYSEIIGAATEYTDIKRDLHSDERGSLQWQRAISRLQQSLVKLQDTINSLIDTDKNPSARGSNRAPEGIKQKLEKKEGLFRMNMMGKRVNFAARSVISPDPNIETNEIGVPPVFAKKLTFPEPVTNHNYYEMKQAVLNGPEKWPGAAAIENESGQLINLKFKNFEERQALANQLLAPSSANLSGARNKKVHRHLNNGDIVIMNRQPTLHKPSMMCHRARVLPGEKTIRMHYANCNTYNADFDGDEMNMHFPQNESARAEAILIADTNHQYLSATAGKPLRGLIQDHLSMGVWLSNKDSYFDRSDYHQLLYSCIRPEKIGMNIITVTPAVIKPKALWTGKQLVTTILANIKPGDYGGLTMTGKSQVPAERWSANVDKKIPNEAQVIFKDGELICGVLDKAQLGPSKGGIVHSVYEAYGETIAGSFLSILGRMLTKLESMRAFSCGMEDIVLTRTGNQTRRALLEEADQVGHEVATKYVSLDASRSRIDKELIHRLEDVLRDDKKQQGLDTVFNSRTALLSSGITKGCLPNGLFKSFPRNQMQTMTVSGAKGSAVNANLISCNLGQQVLEGRRTPTMVSGKTLPAFKPYETSIRAGGYITNRFLTGVQPQEYYFHTMAGREGLIDTAVKTSRSGYLQRCIIKGMEGLQVNYDTTVRDSDGSVVQFLYGEDGLDITKQVHLTNFKFQAENWVSAAHNLRLSDTTVTDPSQWKEEVVSENQRAAREYLSTGDLGASDPVLSLYNPSSTWGCTSEKFSNALKAYVKENPDRLLKDKKLNPGGMPKKHFRMLLDMMYMRSTIDPGEPVGIIAGQSIGEPSTQMTLNTFHLAGHSAKNVTLGIPRLREIVMTATANLATPQMKLYLDEDVSIETAEKFAKGITKRVVADALDKVTVTERVGAGMVFARAKVYDIRLEFFSAREYRETYAFTEEDLARAVEISLLPLLDRAIRKEMKDKGLAKAGKSQSQPVVGKSYGASEAPKGGSNEEEGSSQHFQSAQEEQNSNNETSSDDSDTDEDTDEDGPKKGISAYKGDEDDLRIAQEAREASVDLPEGTNPQHVDEGYGGSPGPESPSDDGLESAKARDSTGRVSKKMSQWRSERIITKADSVSRFEWDVENGQWCEFSLEFDAATEKILMLNLVETACRKAVVQYITNIQSATLDKEKIRTDDIDSESSVNVVVVEGNNIVAMHNYQNVINPHRIFSNDIVAMISVYGVEAGRATIIREMNAVFEGHNISVDNRHLNLIADYMTRNGDFLAFSRTGMKSGVSPFSKMSFETTVSFLRDAVLEQDSDNLSGPSARLVTGRTGKVGTGAFDVFHPVS